MIKFYISYFYQIRNMTPNMLPVSTAMYDPKWFHEGKGTGYRYFDKNHIINGVRLGELCMEQYRVDNLVKKGLMCDQLCSRDAQMCPFMQEYAKCIREKNPDFQKFISSCDGYLQFLNQRMNLRLDTIVFIVHEPPNRKCGERPVIQQWFLENGIELKEFNYSE